jgi:F-type H+-transporting ATPase subunit a
MHGDESTSTMALADILHWMAAPGDDLLRHRLSEALTVVMVPMLFVIEIVSFLFRPFSLGLRLFVAMTAGHILLKVLAGFIVSLGTLGGPALIVTIPTLALLIGISALELLVSAIQAYVFALLTSLYLNDAVNLH